MGSSPTPPPQSITSSYTWGRLLDMQRRLGGGSLNLNAQDQLDIINQVSSFAYTRYLWPFTLATTVNPNNGAPQIPCVNGLQDYPSPSNLRALSRAWFNVPTVNTAANDGTVPPYDDPSALALAAAVLSANYVGSLGNGGGTPAAQIYPSTGSLTLVKRLPVNLNMWSYAQIGEITQQPNSGQLRLSAATAVNSNQPYSLELEYQPVRPPVSSPSEKCWFPDDYVRIGQAGLLYYVYLYNNDQRAGVATYSDGGAVNYSGQLAVWMGALESSAAAERAGSIDNFTPDTSVGADTGYGGFWF